MKRLIKKSEFFSFINKNNVEDNLPLEVYKSPISSVEINTIKQRSKYNSMRGVIYDDGTVYIWQGEILHDSINSLLQNNSKIDIDQFRFAYEPSFGWLIDAHNEYNFNELVNLIIKYENILSQLGNVNKGDFAVLFVNDKDKEGRYTLEELKKYQNNHNYFDSQEYLDSRENMYARNNNKRLIKQSEIYDGFRYYGTYFEVFKNPIASKDIEVVKKVGPNSGVRGVIDSSNNMYIWPAEIDHYNINKYTIVPVDNFRFAYGPDYQIPWSIDVTGLGGNLNLNDTIEIMKNNINVLQQIGSINTKFEIFANGEQNSIFGDSLKDFLLDNGGTDN